MTKENAKKFSAWIKLQNAGLWFGILYLLFSVLWFVLSFRLQYYSEFGPGPGMYPRWISGLSIIVAGIYIWKSCTKQIFLMGSSFPAGKELFNVFKIFVACIVFIFLLNIAGFIITGSLFLFVALFKHYKLWQVVIISILVTVILFYLFKVCFSVPLPVTALGF